MPKMVKETKVHTYISSLCSNEEQVKGKTKGTSFSKEVMYLIAILTFTKDFVILIKLKKIIH
jgi:hypothetical protein